MTTSATDLKLEQLREEFQQKIELSHELGEQTKRLIALRGVVLDEADAILGQISRIPRKSETAVSRGDQMALEDTLDAPPDAEYTHIEG